MQEQLLTVTKYARDFCVNTRIEKHIIRMVEEFAEVPIFDRHKQVAEKDYDWRYVQWFHISYFFSEFNTGFLS